MMERVREVILANVIHLQSDVHETTNRLNAIVEENVRLSLRLKQLNYDQLLSEKFQCLNISQYQHKMIRRLMSINLQIEELEVDLQWKLGELKYNTNQIENLLENNKLKFDSSTCVNDDFTDIQLDSIVVKKLQKYNLVSVEERYINSLPKPRMPNFKFKKVENAGDKEKHQKIDSKPNKCVVKSKKTEAPKIKMVEDLKEFNSTEKDSSDIGIKDNHVDWDNEIFKGTLPSPTKLSLQSYCIISYAVDPSEFYINIVDKNLIAVERISNDFASNHNSSKTLFPTEAIAKENLNRFCLCYSENQDFWYRVEIINWTNSHKENSVFLYFVDFGFYDYASYKNIRPLLNKYAKIPKCAIKCHLAYLYSSVEDQICEWPTETVEKLHKLISPSNDYIFEITFAQLFNDSWEIDLINLFDGDTSIRKILLEHF